LLNIENVVGSRQADRISANADDNRLDGNGGEDFLEGRAGDDLYVVANMRAVVSEELNAGIDTIETSISYILPENVENLILSRNSTNGGPAFPVDDIDGTGNSLDNRLTGNVGNNRLDGGAGADVLIGGAGNDTYLVDDAGDSVREDVGAESDVADTVESSVDYVLEANIENLSLAGSSDIDGVGNSLANILRGNAGNNRLDGGGGADSISGSDGNDTLIGGVGDDTIRGGETDADLRDEVFAGAGDDTVDGGHGNDELRGDAGDDTLAGGFGVDDVIGGSGDDTMTGSAFSDLLFGGPGSDFVNGGFGFDRVNGGADGDRFFHVGDAGHGSDWIQDYDSAEGDVLLFGGQGSSDNFRVITTETQNAGQAGVDEAFVVYRPTGQILWALVDGAAQDSINLNVGGQEYDLFG
jgi:Ca2+-binding RTX toxin-like protein